MNPFRLGHNLTSADVNFIITEGGIGDYVCYMQSLKYVAETVPHVRGYLYVPNYFKEVADNVMKPYKHWVVNNRDKLSEETIRARPTMAPHHIPINAMGAHPLDLGFMYFAGCMPPPEWNYYAEFNGEGVSPFKDNRTYAILTPGATDENRAMKPKAFNAIKDFLIQSRITPVFLGSAKVGVRPILYDKEYNYEGGLDLRDKTSLIQCLQIMKNAAAVIGIDNGLLHLAAMTKVSVVFGYTIAAPWHREPRRKKGHSFKVAAEIEELSCSFCQSRMTYISHNFKKCIYSDNKCTEILSDPGIWLPAIRWALRDNNLI
jgi:ADP-heptose:LPS heptosyltransferase